MFQLHVIDTGRPDDERKSLAGDTYVFLKMNPDKGRRAGDDHRQLVRDLQRAQCYAP